MITPRKEIMLNGVTATSTSSIVGISESAKISLQLVASGISSGSAVFKIQISNDNTNWSDYNRLTTNVTNTNAQTDLRAATVALTANGSNFAFIPASDTFQFMRAICTVNTDGAYSVIAYIN